MEILQLLLKNWDSVALVTAVFLIIIYLIKTGQTKILKKIAIQFVTEAEKELGDGTGIFKQAAVIEWLYSSMPTVVKVMFTKKDLEKLVDAVVEEVKLKWAENYSIQGYIKSKQKIMNITTMECDVEEINRVGIKLEPVSEIKMK